MATSGTGVVDEDATHRFGRRGVKMAPTGPRHFAGAGQSQVCLVDQRCRREGVPFRLTHHVPLSSAPKLVVDEGQQPVRGGLVARGGGVHQDGGVSVLRGHEADGTRTNVRATQGSFESAGCLRRRAVSLRS